MVRGKTKANDKAKLLYLLQKMGCQRDIARKVIDKRAGRHAR